MQNKQHKRFLNEMYQTILKSVIAYKYRLLGTNHSDHIKFRLAKHNIIDIFIRKKHNNHAVPFRPQQNHKLKLQSYESGESTSTQQVVARGTRIQPFNITLPFIIITTHTYTLSILTLYPYTAFIQVISVFNLKMLSSCLVLSLCECVRE